MARFGLLLIAYCLAAVSHGDVVRLSEPVYQTDSVEVFGAISEFVETPISLPQLLAEADQHLDQAVKVRTRVAKVCQKKGCFFIAQDGASSVRVSFKDYGFFVPTDISGKWVTMDAQLVEVELTEAQSAHFNEDIGDADTVVSQGRQFELVATSVEVPRG